MNQETRSTETVCIAVLGEVDHGKSTLLGRLMADCGAISAQKIATVKAAVAARGTPFSYAFLLDAFREEQDGSITIDACRAFMKAHQRQYLFMDTPGHPEFIRNAVTGAAGADCALLVVDVNAPHDAHRHAFVLHFLGLKKVIVLINKMDLAGHREDDYRRAVSAVGKVLGELSFANAWYIPVSAALGENLKQRAQAMPWYSGHTLFERLAAVHQSSRGERGRFRMFVQDVYQTKGSGQIIVGTALTGCVTKGDRLTAFPGGTRHTVTDIKRFEEECDMAVAGEAIGLVVSPPATFARGELFLHTDAPPPAVTSQLAATVFCFGETPLREGDSYLLRIGSASAGCKVERILSTIDARSGKKRLSDSIAPLHGGECVLTLDRVIAYEHSPAGCGLLTSRFVLVHGGRIVGGGIIRDTAHQSAAVRPDAPSQESRM